ncbi:hypothetical protein W822_16225 [Advenella kashmirensis W13003]|uniref:Uncharacterized protein n=1 Tax=Advenella kashmirensis W13003 TaxID=1424334 RepID=V8QSY0_9BURK|nr:hypothetical protein [Advenella kashmirensis]ETF02440.1 hypothetical protein W822_16225 [Advenella kashmirensis W13003]
MELPAWIANYISLWLLAVLAVIVVGLLIMQRCDQRRRARLPSGPGYDAFQQKLKSINLDLDAPDSDASTRS